MKYEVLFICTANVGRSQMAEAFYKYYCGKGKCASAAGIEDKRKKYEFHPHPSAIGVMLEKGIDISQNLVNLVTLEMVRNSKRIISFCDIKKCHNFLASNPKARFVHIEDPYLSNMGAQEELARFRLARNRIEQFVQNLINGQKQT